MALFTRTTDAAGVLALLSTLSLLVLSDFEHCRTIRPSALIQLFLFFTILLDLPRLRTLWLLGNDGYVVANPFYCHFLTAGRPASAGVPPEVEAHDGFPRVGPPLKTARRIWTCFLLVAHANVPRRI